MAEFTISIAGAEAKLADLGRQAPFALALALTSLARDVAAAEEAEIGQAFDRPTPFTMRAVGIAPATKLLPVASVFIRDIQAEYLAIQTTGGERRPKPGAPILTPADIRLDPYGNIPRGAIRRERAKAGTFAASPKDPRTKHLPAGIYRRPSRAARRRGAKAGEPPPLKLLAALRPQARYRARLPFRAVAEATVRARAALRLAEAKARALASARR